MGNVRLFCCFLVHLLCLTSSLDLLGSLDCDDNGVCSWRKKSDTENPRKLNCDDNGVCSLGKMKNNRKNPQKYDYKGSRCFKESKYFGEIYGSNNGKYNMRSKCWIIPVPKNSYVVLSLSELHFREASCLDAFIKITVDGTEEEYYICSQDADNWKSVFAFTDVYVTFVARQDYLLSFTLHYNIESKICIQANHFRCSVETCIHESQVCDNVRDCINGSDEIGCVTKIGK